MAMTAFLEVRCQARVEVVPLDDAPLSIGKGPAVDVRLTDDPTVSRLHAIVEPVGRGWCVRDLGSHNGTFVNGARVWSQQALHTGDEITVGTTHVVYRAHGPGSGQDDSTVTASTQPAPTLTRRERDVLIALCRPLLTGGVFTPPASIRDIAAELYVSEAAVKQHLANLYGKFALYDEPGGASRRVRLANEAVGRAAVTLADLKAPPG